MRRLAVRLVWMLTDPWVAWRYRVGRRHVRTRLWALREIVNRLYWWDNRAAGLGGRFGTWVNSGQIERDLNAMLRAKEPYLYNAGLRWTVIDHELDGRK